MVSKLMIAIYLPIKALGIISDNYCIMSAFKKQLTGAGLL